MGWLDPILKYLAAVFSPGFSPLPVLSVILAAMSALRWTGNHAKMELQVTSPDSSRNQNRRDVHVMQVYTHSYH
jgi:hypothetical protein